MELIDKFSRTLGLSPQNEDKESESANKKDKTPTQPEQPEPPIQPPPPPSQPQQSSTLNILGHNVIDFNSAERDNFMANNNTNNNAKSMVKSKITTIRPKNFDEDAKVIADCLRDDIPVIINLEETNPEHARRIIDFALGTTYAIEGDVQQVSELVFICTPKNVIVTFNREEPKQPDHNDFSWLTGKI